MHYVDPHTNHKGIDIRYLYGILIPHEFGLNITIDTTLPLIDSILLRLLQ